MLRCSDVGAELDAYLDGELDEAHASEVAVHLEDCPACREALADRRKVALAVKRLPAVGAPAGFVERFRAARASEPVPAAAPAVRRQRMTWLVGSVAAAAAALLMAAVLIPGRRPTTLGKAPAPDARRSAELPDKVAGKKVGKADERTFAEGKHFTDDAGPKPVDAPESPDVWKNKKGSGIPAAERRPNAVAGGAEGKKELHGRSPGFAQKPAPKPVPKSKPQGEPKGVVRPSAPTVARPPAPPPPSATPTRDEAKEKLRKAREQLLNEKKKRDQRAVAAYVCRISTMTRRSGRATPSADDPARGGLGAARKLTLRSESQADAAARLVHLAKRLGGGEVKSGRSVPKPEEGASLQTGRPGAAPRKPDPDTGGEPTAKKDPAKKPQVTAGAGSGSGDKKLAGPKAEKKGAKASGRTLLLYLPADQVEIFAKALTYWSGRNVHFFGAGAPGRAKTKGGGKAAGRPEADAEKVFKDVKELKDLSRKDLDAMFKLADEMLSAEPRAKAADAGAKGDYVLVVIQLGEAAEARPAGK